MIKSGLTFGAATSDRVDCGAFAALNTPAAGTLAAWFLPTSQGAVAQRLMAKNTFNFSHANASNNRVVLEIPRATTFLRALTEAANFPVNWVSRLGSPVFMAATYNTASGLPKLFIGDLNSPATEPSSYITQQVGTGAVTSLSGSNLLIGGNGSTISMKGIIFSAFVALVEYSTNEVRQLQRQMMQDFRSCAGRWELGGTGWGRVIDQSGKGNHGTITGAVLTSHVLPMREPSRRLRYRVPSTQKRFFLIPS